MLSRLAAFAGCACAAPRRGDDRDAGTQRARAGPIYSVQGHRTCQFFPASCAALDATYYAGGHTTINGEKDQRLENVRVGVTAALSLSRTTR